MPQREKQTKESASHHQREQTESKENKAEFNPSAADMFKMFSDNMKMPAFDKEGLLNNHRKNLEAMNDANKMAVEVLKNIAQMQSQYVRQTFDDMNAVMRDMVTTPPSKDNWKNHASKVKDAMTKAVDHTASIANVMTQSNQDMYKVMQERQGDLFNKIKETATKYKH